ncbi:MAG TPA: putative lipid II flippase FtsW [Longimicrobiales bacterium]|nr:putative lipid II flippase FtsW [Longimicrobiales bacterium]
MSARPLSAARERLRRGMDALGTERPEPPGPGGWEAPALLILTLALLAFGLVMVYSASAVMAQSRGLPDYHFVVRQALGGAAGLLALVICAQVRPALLRALAWPILAASGVLLLITILPGTETIAPRVNGARRWLSIGPLTIQPVEFAKLAVIVWTAALAVRKRELLRSLSRGLLPFLLVWGGLALLLVLQPDYSSAALLVMLASLVVFAAGGRPAHFVALGLVGTPLALHQISGATYRAGRVAAFLDPAGDTGGVAYQINQALIAVGSGGWLGRGVGRGQQKFGFLPEPHNDFLFAMIGEEWGLLGTAAILAAFVAFALIGYRIARRSAGPFEALLAIGLTNLIVVQALLHMAVNLALVPTTGLTLPFLSYGRSSLIVCLAAAGLLISLARAADEEARGRERRTQAERRRQVAARRNRRRRAAA